MSRSSQRRVPRLASLVIAAIAAGGGAHIHAADQADDQRSNTPNTARADRADKVCQRVRPVGSNIPTTICRTRQQMADEEAAAREALNHNRVRQN